MSDRDDDEPKGYANPPKGYQFGPGQSGNPKGRPKGVARTKDDIVARVFGRAVSRTGKDGEEEQVPIIEHVLDKTAMAAANGDRWARRDVLRLLNRAPYIISMAANDNDGKDEEIAKLKLDIDALSKQLQSAGELAEALLDILEEETADVASLHDCLAENYSVLEDLVGFIYRNVGVEQEQED